MIVGFVSKPAVGKRLRRHTSSSFFGKLSIQKVIFSSRSTLLRTFPEAGFSEAGVHEAQKANYPEDPILQSSVGELDLVLNFFG